MSNYQTRRIEVCGCEVDVVTFGRKSFYYPHIGDQEFPVSSRGFRKMSHFIRTCRYFANAINEIGDTLLTPPTDSTHQR